LDYTLSKIKNMKTPTDFKIFLVDDDAFSLAIYEQRIKGLGYQNVTAFTSGTDCLNSLIEKPQVIFLDHAMAPINGFELLKKIKRFDPNIYVVMVSGQEDMQQALDALRFGAFDYLIKGQNESEKMQSVLDRIAKVQEMLKKKRPTIFRKLVAAL